MLPLIMAGLGVAGGIGKMFARAKANKDLKGLMKQDPVYQQNPIAAQRMALAQQLFNARMPGAATVERNIYSGMGNTVGAAQRNATDSSQLLSVAAAAQGQANQGFNQLGIQEAQDQQRRYQNLVGAQEGVINEGDKAFQDQTRRFGNKVGMQGQINENRQNSWQEISNLGFGLSDFGMSGGLNGLFGGNQQQGSQQQGTQFDPFFTNQILNYQRPR